LSACRKKKNNNRDNSAGAVLVLVLVVLLGLTGMVMATLDITAENTGEIGDLALEYQAGLVAESGLEIALARLMDDEIRLADTPQEPWAKPLQDRWLRIEITPCNARININSVLTASNPFRAQRAVQQLVIGAGLSQDRLLYLADWLDSDFAETAPGGEDLVYHRKWPRYGPRNSGLDRPEELLLVFGWENTDPEWVTDHFTTWGDVDRININFTTEETFSAWLPELRLHWSRIESRRQSRGFEHVSQLASLLGALENEDLYMKLEPYLTVSSEYFRIMVEVELPDWYELRRYIVYRRTTRPGYEPEIIAKDVLSSHAL